jgi:hypothetical protein
VSRLISLVNEISRVFPARTCSIENDDRVSELGPDPEASVAALFESELARRAVGFRALGDLRYEVDTNGELVTVAWIGNLVRDVTTTGDLTKVDRFVDVVLRPPLGLPATWAEARGGLRWNADTADVALGDTIAALVSTAMARRLVYVDPDETAVRFVSPVDLDQWSVSENEASVAAFANLDTLLERTPLHVEHAGSMPLAWFDTPSPSKASLIFAPSLREAVVELLGWPIMAVAPARDFVYLFRVADADELIGRVGPVVVEEYASSAYPVTNEVLEIGDQGVRAVGQYG